MIAQALTLETALIAAVVALVSTIGGLVTAIVFLYGRLERVSKRLQNDIDACNKERRELTERIIRLEVSSCIVTGCKQRAAGELQ